MSFGNDRRNRGVRRSVRMSVSKIPASPKDYPDEYERRFRVGGARPASVEDVGLAELARKLAPVRPSPEAQAVSEYDQWGAAPIEAATPHSAVAFVRGKPSGPARRDLEATQISGFAVPCSRDLRYPGPATGRRSGPWTRTLAPVGAALLFGAALFVAVFVPKGGSTGARSHIMQPALVKIVGSGELPTAVHADASRAATRSSAASEPSPNDLAAPTPVAPPPTAPTSWARIATPSALSSAISTATTGGTGAAGGDSRALRHTRQRSRAPRRPSAACWGGADGREQGRSARTARSRPAHEAFPKNSRPLDGRQDCRDRAQRCHRDAAPAAASW